MKFAQFTYLLFLVLLANLSMAQTRYNMSNRIVNECKGILVDSEVGNSDFPAGYFHNENFVFTICVPNSPQVILSFSSFHTEECCDSLEIFDGPDVNSPRIGTYKGFNSPGVVSSTGSCLTIRFRSDANINAEGWEASWKVIPPVPIPPVITAIPNVPCKSTSVRIDFDKPVLCSQLTKNNFTYTGPAGGSISSVTPINCVNGSASSALISFTSPLNESGTYTLLFSFVFIDICGEVHNFQLTKSFNIIDCPLIVDVLGANVACAGGCTLLTADVKGGNPANYVYTWSPGGETTASIQACPTVPTQYRVTVSDGASQPASDTITVSPIPLPNAGNDTTLCRFDAPIFLSGSPVGGSWAGPGITNATTGRFNPASAGAGTHRVLYYGPNGCADTVLITVNQVLAGNPQSLCLNSAPINLIGTPTGGTWAGTFTTSTGVFTPNASGVYAVTYTEPINGCKATQNITVVDSIDIPPLDSMIVCINQAPFNIRRSPNNGFWTGKGINGGGTFNPSTAGEGTHVLYYNINGCRDSTNVQVSVISAGNDTLVCPSNASFLLYGGSPIGGTWSGTGVTANPDSTFTFAPSATQANSNVVLTYTFGSCSATRIFYNYFTDVTNDTLQFCPYDGAIALNDALTKPNLPGGMWSGMGLVTSDSVRVNPKLLSTGIHYVYYEYNNNGCRDSLAILIKVKPNAQNDVSVCPEENDFNLTATPAGGVWRGFGIIDSVQGTYSPKLTQNGSFNLIYTLAGCTDTTTVNVTTITTKIGNFKPYYCFKDALQPFIANPTGGTWKGSGVNPSGQFNPALAGAGTHQIIYTFGSGNCAVHDTAYVKVIAPIRLDVDYVKSKLCYGDSVLLTATAAGGDSTRKYTYNWSPSIGNNNRRYVKPTGPTTITVAAYDGCSDSTKVIINLDVWPEILYDLEIGPSVCFGEPNWAKVNLLSTPKSDYLISWDTKPVTKADEIFVEAGKYTVSIKQNFSGCIVKKGAFLKTYSQLIANYSKSPDVNERDVLNAQYYFVNLSRGGTKGYWDFGDSTRIAFDPNGSPEHTYQDTGTYHVKLYVENEGGCKDSILEVIRIVSSRTLYVPTGFTPNGDGKNDFFPEGYYENGIYKPFGFGLLSYEMFIFNRWGELLYETDKAGTPWNGRIQNTGSLVLPEVYVYRLILHYGEYDIVEKSGKITVVR